MTTTAQIMANRENAQHSTGPKTPAGKAASAKNATRHGLSSANFALLPDEDPAAFDRLHQSLKNDFEPATDHEFFLIELMAKAKWKIDRIDRLEAAALDELFADDAAGPATQALLNTLKTNNSVLDKLQRYHTAAERSYFKALRELQSGRAANATKQNDANALIVDALFNGPVRERPKRRREQNEPEPAVQPARAMAASAALRL